MDVKKRGIYFAIFLLALMGLSQISASSLPGWMLTYDSTIGIEYDVSDYFINCGDPGNYVPYHCNDGSEPTFLDYEDRDNIYSNQFAIGLCRGIGYDGLTSGKLYLMVCGDWENICSFDSNCNGASQPDPFTGNYYDMVNPTCEGGMCLGEQKVFRDGSSFEWDSGTSYRFNKDVASDYCENSVNALTEVNGDYYKGAVEVNFDSASSSFKTQVEQRDGEFVWVSYFCEQNPVYPANLLPAYWSELTSGSVAPAYASCGRYGSLYDCDFEEGCFWNPGICQENCGDYVEPYFSCWGDYSEMGINVEGSAIYVPSYDCGELTTNEYSDSYDNLGEFTQYKEACNSHPACVSELSCGVDDENRCTTGEKICSDDSGFFKNPVTTYPPVWDDVKYSDPSMVLVCTEDGIWDFYENCPDETYCQGGACVSEGGNTGNVENGNSCESDSDCQSGNCRVALVPEGHPSSGTYCTPAGKECSKVNSDEGFDAGDTLGLYDQLLCAGLDVSVECSYSKKCNTYANHFCDGSSWQSGDGTGYVCNGANTCKDGMLYQDLSCNGDQGTLGSCDLPINPINCDEGEICQNGQCIPDERTLCQSCNPSPDNCESGLICAEVIGNPGQYQCVTESTGACANGESSSCEESETTTKCADTTTVKTCSNNNWATTENCVGSCSTGECTSEPQLFWTDQYGRALSTIEVNVPISLYVQNYEESGLNLPIYYGSNLKDSLSGSALNGNTIALWTTSLPTGVDSSILYYFQAMIEGTEYESPMLNVIDSDSTCGNTIIETGEECDEGENNAYTCSYDVCESSCTYCHKDTCQIETVSNPTPPQCGDGNCNCGETFNSCSTDCGCGDGVCDGSESESTCPTDCGCDNDGNCESSRGELYPSCSDCDEPLTLSLYWATTSGTKINNPIYLDNDDLSGKQYRLYVENPTTSTPTFEIKEYDTYPNGNDLLAPSISSKQLNSNGYYVTWTTSYADFVGSNDVLFGDEDPFKFFFQTNGETSGNLEIYVNGDIPECGDDECNGDETPETCEADCQIDPCEGKTLCSDYTPEGQAVCEADTCNLSSATVPGEPGPYETEVCYWTGSTCEGKTIVGDEDGIIIGECLYSESETEDDCSDGFYTYSWTTQWQWDESNRFIDNSSIDPWYWDSTQGFYRKDSLVARQNCNLGSGQEVIPCPAQIQLDFFNTKNLIAAILLILVGYLIIQNNKNRGKKQKPIKKKTTDKKLTKKKTTKKKATTKKSSKKKATSKKPTSKKKK